jgi:hypothetical protein
MQVDPAGRVQLMMAEDFLKNLLWFEKRRKKQKYRIAFITHLYEQQTPHCTYS